MQTRGFRRRNAAPRREDGGVLPTCGNTHLRLIVANGTSATVTIGGQSVGGGLLARGSSYSAGSWGAHSMYHADGNGNITYLVSNASAKTGEYRYDPDRRTTSSSGSLATANAYRFSSKLWHERSAFCYHRFRFDDPLTQRWINRDPIEEAGGRNLYGFIDNNPINRVDIDGRIVPVIVVGGMSIGALEVAAAFGSSNSACLSTPVCRDAAMRLTQEALDEIPGAIHNLWRHCRPKRCLPCIPLVGSIAYRVDMPPSPPHNGSPTPHCTCIK